MTTSHKKSFDYSGFIILALLFVAVIMLSNAVLRGMRWDLTESGLYTMSEGTRNVLDKIEEPINLYFMFSDQATGDMPGIRTYATRVRELLDELVLHADGKLRLEVIDPQPFSEEEDMASKFGLQAVPIGASGEAIYFGLAATNTVDDAAAIGFFHPNKETFLEYDVSKLIYTLANPQRPVIGIMSGLPMLADYDPRAQGVRDAWVIAEQMQSLLETRRVPLSTQSIDEDIEVLMVAHPKNLDEQTQYAIDQFILRGGKAMIFVDPMAEMDQPAAPMDPMQALSVDRSSNLERLFEAWGIEYDPGEIVADLKLALPVSTGVGQTTVPHAGLLGARAEQLNQDDVVTGDLDVVNFGSPGFFRKTDESPVEMEVLVHSSTQASPMDAGRLRFLSDPAALLNGFAPTGEQYVLAARLGGRVPSAFPDGPPSTGDDAGPDDENPGDGEATEHLTESAGAISVILVADTDVLTDRLWVRVERFFGQRLATAWASNGDFVVNALDNLSGSNDLISIRGRASYTRPFTTVQELERKAGERLRAKEQELEQSLTDTEQKLTELQAQRSDGDLSYLTSEQSEEIQRFQQQVVEIRKQLRQVRRELNQDKERLGTMVKVINIGLVPLLLTLVVLGFVVVRRRRIATAIGR